EGKFHIYPVATIDEGIEILTGVAAGTRGADGRYPPQSVNGLVDERLRSLSSDRPNGNQERMPREKAGGASEEPPADQPPHEPELPGEQPEPPGSREPGQAE
ncbi:MAG TPA: hypothetical protein VGA61_12795, partial [Anaerolineae bacterium]